MSEQSPASSPDRHPDPLAGDGPADPEHDSTAAYALDRSYVAGLTGRVVSTTGETHAVSSPIGGAPLAYVPQSSTQDVAEAFVRARRAQVSWAATSLDERAAALLRLHDLLLDRQDELIDLVVWESGKARKDAYLEVAHLALTARYYARTAHEHLDTRRVGGMFPLLTRAEVSRVPKGVVGIISPWNYPLTMALCDGLPALLAGNAVVAKPDAQTMLTALLAARLLDQAGFPAELWQVVAGPGPEVGGAVVAGADYVCFTGSTATGRLIARQCADRLIGCSLELGGKNPMLVLRDADVQRAAEGAVRGVFSNAGQLCVSTERLFVADQVYDRFVDAFVSRTQALTLGASLDWSVDMGSLISQAQLDAVTAHVDDAVAKGARVLAGGKARPDLGPFVFEPTILEGVSADMECFARETFGPVVSLYRFHGEDEAVARANDGSYGLNASIWTRDGARGRALARRIRCGTVNVNEAYGATFGSLGAPMGGMRESGVGRRQGAEGIHRYTEAQSVATQRLVPIAPMLGMSEETNAKVLTASLRLLNKLGRA
ncbi:succinic semialdehyde dehydrogenase [Nocardioides sp. Soil774]|uniref:succinic semialdehyde dehydrogenase n=1 Tax=Nocardioides sp. Soil774 TaxID=1736408 RepID=UPI0009EC58A2|nr:succinic semialdehyde dehydrogenase [Nocardioides sp. Soil774]